MAGVIETDIPGEPAAFRALADYLRSSLAARAEDLADQTAAQRSSLAGVWLGAAADAFGDRVGVLVTAADGFAREARATAAQIEALGEALELAQEGMSAVRTAAAAGGLRVEGTTIGWPADAWQRDLLETTRVHEVWNAALAGAEGHRRTWYAALDHTAGFAQRQSSTLVGLTIDLVTTAAERTLLLKASRIMAGEAEFRASEVSRLRGQMAELAESIRRFDRPGDRELYGRLMDEEIANRHAADSARDAAKHPELPREVRAGFGVLSAVAAGYGVYADIEDGESTEQAVVSQGGGLIGGAVGAGLLGGAAGTGMFPGPGTVTGAVLVGGGALVGGAIGSFFGDKLVDHAYEHGDSEGDDDRETGADPGTELLEYAAESLSSPDSAGHRVGL